MPNYKNIIFFSKNDSSTFDQAFHPATATPTSGIYRCTGCGHEVSSTKGHPLPPQTHHQHTLLQGAILWQLVAASIHVHPGKD